MSKQFDEEIANAESKGLLVKTKILRFQKIQFLQDRQDQQDDNITIRDILGSDSEEDYTYIN